MPSRTVPSRDATVAPHGPFLGYEYADRTDDTVQIYDFIDVRDVVGLRCPYCSESLVTVPATTDDSGLCQCRTCGWWKLLDLEGVSGGWGFKTIQSYTSVATHFRASDLDVPIALLRRYLSEHPADVAHTDPVAFEHLVADCLRDGFAPCEVVHMGGPNDGGVDLCLILSDSSSYFVQVKRRMKIHRNEGVEVVRTLNGVLFQRGVPTGMVVTTAKGFSRAAHEATAVSSPTIAPYDMKLIAFEELVSMLRLTPSCPYEPWRRFEFARQDCGPLAI